jgi:uncharacterized protein
MDSLLSAVVGHSAEFKDILWAVLGSVCIILGIIGCIIQIIPGPPLSWLGLLLLYFTPYSKFSGTFLIIWAVIVLIAVLLDYLLPSSFTQKLGGTKAGIRGSAIGMIIGIFVLPPVGMILGPIIGAFIGELIAKRKTGTAFRSAIGAFLGFLITTGLKLIISLIIAFLFFKELFF